MARGKSTTPATCRRHQDPRATPAHGAPDRTDANRNTKRLETALSRRKHSLHTRSNRDKNACFSNARFARPAETSDRSNPAPFIFVSVRKNSAVCFVGVTENLNEPLFRLEIAEVLAGKGEASYITRRCRGRNYLRRKCVSYGVRGSRVGSKGLSGSGTVQSHERAKRPLRRPLQLP
jgi:hypothetical protein